MAIYRDPPMAAQCKTCIFRPDGLPPGPGRMAEIQAYLIDGKTHLCHSVEGRACRGGRDYQVQVWHRLGLIPGPTDAALESALADLEASGVEVHYRGEIGANR